jgi:hypothetical protein
VVGFALALAVLKHILEVPAAVHPVGSSFVAVLALMGRAVAAAAAAGRKQQRAHHQKYESLPHFIPPAGLIAVFLA